MCENSSVEQSAANQVAEEVLWLSFSAKRRIPPDSKPKTKRDSSRKIGAQNDIVPLFFRSLSVKSPWNQNAFGPVETAPYKDSEYPHRV